MRQPEVHTASLHIGIVVYWPWIAHRPSSRYNANNQMPAGCRALALIENNLVGILAMLDEQCRISKESHEPLVAA